MSFEELLRKNRSCRRFHQDQSLDQETLVGLVELTRFCPSGANRQPLKFCALSAEEENAAVFRHLGWAKWLPEWSGPAEGDRPAAYIVILGDTEIADRFDCDAAIAAHTILLGATALGLGGCMIGWIDREGLAETLNVPDRYRILLVVALGVPKESVVLETTAVPHDVAYWRDSAGVHHVPKRPLEEVLIRFEPISEPLRPTLAAVDEPSPVADPCRW